MPAQREAPFGSWKSPITSDLIVGQTIGLAEVGMSGDEIYWIESRPSEAGRYVLVRRTPDGQVTDVNPPPLNARNRVHEYGGGSYALAGQLIYFSNFSDNRIYTRSGSGEAQPLTPPSARRYADLTIDRSRSALIAVREDHSLEGQEPVNTIVSIDLRAGGAGKPIVSGNDFFSSPRVSPDGKQLAWLSWNHPNMPWDMTELWLGELDAEGSITKKQKVAGGDSISICQPEWSPEGVLHYVSDQSGWWNLYRWNRGKIEPLHEMEAEFSGPQWVFGSSTYAFESPNRIICAANEKGNWNLAVLDTAAHKFERLATPYTEISYLRASSGRVLFCGGSPTQPTSVVQLNLATREIEVLRQSTNLLLDPAYLSIPRAIEFPTEGGLTAHGFYYGPRNRDYIAPAEERPPLIVISHGGPTSATTTTLKLPIQYWTSRGFGVLDVNYGGSSGYGRAYRQRLNGNWGIVDVDDCINGARYLVDRGEVDGSRLIIRGGSAGGYTTLAALTFRNVFKVGASYYGISDLEALEEDGHKFESRYNNSLVGPYPEKLDLYRERSPIHFTEQLSCPMILFQGLEDKVVPPNQSEKMYEAVKAKGLPVAYVPFEGEQHGFRKAENIKRSLDAELYFYSKVFGFELADPVEPVHIDNI